MAQQGRKMPFCIKCGQDYNPKRAILGYRTCLDCGSPKIKFPVIPVTKSNYIVGTIADLQHSYAAKGPR